MKPILSKQSGTVLKQEMLISMHFMASWIRTFHGSRGIHLLGWIYKEQSGCMGEGKEGYLCQRLCSCSHVKK